MDNVKAPVPGPPQGEPGDIDIFLFSNGETHTPPRKYHLTAQELNYWDSTLNFLARAQFGYLHSSIDLYTIDGKKIETPLELANNNTYVAVESKDTFLPGGYDQYLMKASKSWIKRYGSVSSSTTSKEKVTTGTALQSEITTNNTKLEMVTEVKEIKEVEESTIEVIETALINTELNDTRKPEATKLQTNNDVQKPGEKKKTVTRSSILRKNISNIHTNGKNHLNAKEKPPPTPSPLKKRPGSPPVKSRINKVAPPRKESLIKAVYSSGKSKQNMPQNNNKISAGPDVELIIPDKLSTKPECLVQREPISKEINNFDQNFDQVTKDEQFYDTVNQIFPPNDDILKREISTREYPDNEARNQITDTVKILSENIDGYYGITQNKKFNDGSALTKSFSTEMQHGDVIKLRLSVEVTQEDNKCVEDKNLPMTNNELWSIVIQEKSSQVNMDEMVFQQETLKGILEELQKNKPNASQEYVILHCDCCNNYLHKAVKLDEETFDNQSFTVKKIRNNKDYVMLIPYIKPDDDILGCKCDEAIPKSDKIVQTSFTFEMNDYSKGFPYKQTVDKGTDAPRSSLDVRPVSHIQPRVSLCDGACGTSEILLENKVFTIPPPLKESRTVPEQCPASASTPKISKPPSITKVCAQLPAPKENLIVPTEYLVCTNKSKGIAMLDKATQTDSYCFLLEARRHSDGHYSFHLPPLHLVKLYGHSK